MTLEMLDAEMVGAGSPAVDLGACAIVANPEDIPNYPVMETTHSKAVEEFAAASGDPIPNLSGMKIPIVTRDLAGRLMSVTTAPALKPLVSVKQLFATGHTLVFDSASSYIMNKATGELNYLREEIDISCWTVGCHPTVRILVGIHSALRRAPGSKNAVGPSAGEGWARVSAGSFR